MLQAGVQEQAVLARCKYRLRNIDRVLDGVTSFPVAEPTLQFGDADMSNYEVELLWVQLVALWPIRNGR